MDNYQENYRRGKQLVEAAPQTYIDVDLEADGKPGLGSILSIGAVSPRGKEFYQELKPLDKRWLPNQHRFCEEHGLPRQRLEQEGTNPIEAIEEFDLWARREARALGKTALTLAAFNASFDFPFVDLYYQKAKLRNPFGAAGFCIKSLAQALGIAAYDWTATYKTNLPPDIKPPEAFTHNALEDARWQQGLHYALIGKLAILLTK